jgi:hypothetical protein
LAIVQAVRTACLAPVTLAEHSSDMLRLACTKCERRGQYRKATLIERYGPDMNLVAAAVLQRLRRRRSL